ncbi:MAG: LLM class flavin-dependent oxidoreductase [Microthrixaceae bacterium]|nr:LLM class flavin-dependent oxidoreductase [Microthrixaceae bacterium]MCO5313676.1 LLM class flavin-dependent oxidoreductase [Microthrixaceae bacterium]HPB45033.1 LLM class flavin-dependent oxidoreductase [Microthrixaceae bacterium]
MKIRIGVGTGVGQTLEQPSQFGEVVDLVESLGFDSLWVSDRVVGESLDPTVSLAIAAGRTSRIKLGANVWVLPGRDPYLMAKQLASLSLLSDGRLLPAFGLGSPHPADREPFGVAKGRRVAMFEEGLSVVRALWAGESIPHPHGGSALRLKPRPAEPLDIWFGARSEAALARTGRLADGWIGSFQTPRRARHCREVVLRGAEDAGRTFDLEHFGMTIMYARHQRTELGRFILSVLGGDDRSDSTDGGGDGYEAACYPCGADELVAVLNQHIDAGISKFVLSPADAPEDWGDELRWLREVTGPLET